MALGGGGGDLAEPDICFSFKKEREGKGGPRGQRHRDSQHCDLGSEEDDLGVKNRVLGAGVGLPPRPADPGRCLGPAAWCLGTPQGIG